VGEPLIDGNLEDKIAYARSKNSIKNIHLTTNAILLTPKRFNALVDAGLNMITISMSDFDPSEYKKIFRNSSAYKKIIRNLCLISKSENFRSCNMEIGIRTSNILYRFNRQFREFRRSGYIISRTKFFDDWSGRIKDADLIGYMFLRPDRKNKKIPCQMLYAGPTVLSNGDVTACGCRDLEGNSELRLGSVLTDPFRDIVSDQKLSVIRKRFIRGDLPGICRDCRFYYPMSKILHLSKSGRNRERTTVSKKLT